MVFDSGLNGRIQGSICVFDFLSFFHLIQFVYAKMYTCGKSVLSPKSFWKSRIWMSTKWQKQLHVSSFSDCYGNSAGWAKIKKFQLEKISTEKKDRLFFDGRNGACSYQGMRIWN